MTFVMINKCETIFESLLLVILFRLLTLPQYLLDLGWEYATDGKCEKMPSTRLLNVKLKALPCFEQEGMIWIWPGDDPPEATLPSLLPPPGFQIHAEVCNHYHQIFNNL